MINIDNIRDVCRGGVECGEGYINIISCKEGLELINLLKSYQKDAERYRWLRDKASIENHGGFEYDLPLIHAIRYMEGPELNQEMTFDEAVDNAMMESEDE